MDENMFQYFVERTDNRLESIEEKLDVLVTEKHYLLGQVRIVSIVFSTLTSTVIAILITLLTQYLKN
jgi:hypothetical protein